MLPYLIAQALDSPLICDAVSDRVSGDAARLIQALPRGRARALRVALPVTLTVERSGPKPRMSAFGPGRRGLIRAVAVDLAVLCAGNSGRLDFSGRTGFDPAGCSAYRAVPAERLRNIQSVRAVSGTLLLEEDPCRAARAIWQ